MDETIEEEGPPVECSQGLCHLWFGFQNLATKAFQTFQQSGHAIQKVSMGQKHCAFLTVHGQVYMYGNNNSGQLGHGGFDNQYVEPVFVKELCDSFIVDISCGKWHTAAVSSTGQVYCWGSSVQGQCGNQSRTNPLPVKVNLVKQPSTSDGNFQAPDNGGQSVKQKELKPKNIQKIDSDYKEVLLLGEDKTNVPEDCDGDGVGVSVKVVQVECGGSHTMAICDQGELWGWGCGAYLGLNISENSICSIPRRIDFMTGRKVIRVSCGERHTLSVVQKLPLSNQLNRQRNVPQVLKGSLVKKQNKTKVGDNSKDSSMTLKTGRQTSASSTCEQCHSPVRTPKGSNCKYEEDEDALHVCPLGLEITSDGKIPQILSSSIKTSKSPGASRSSLDSRSMDTDSTCSSVDPLGGGVGDHTYQTAESSPLAESKAIEGSRCSTTSLEESEPIRFVESVKVGVKDSNSDDAEESDITFKERSNVLTGETDMEDVDNICLAEVTKAVLRRETESKRINNESEVGTDTKINKDHREQIEHEDIDNISLAEVTKDISKEGDILKRESESTGDIDKGEIPLPMQMGMKEDGSITVAGKSLPEHSVENDGTISEDSRSTKIAPEQQISISSDYINIELSSSQDVEIDQRKNTCSQVSVHEQISPEQHLEAENCDIEKSAITSYGHDLGSDHQETDQKYCVLEFSNSGFDVSGETEDISVKQSFADSDKDVYNGKTDCIAVSGSQKLNEMKGVMDGQVNGDILRQKLSSTDTNQEKSRDSSDSLLGSLTKSRSTFLDETEAKEFLDRQLSGDDVLVVSSSTEGSITSPLSKKVENILQYVPNTSTALAMQEYVKSWTTSMVTNIRSQVETTMDKFGIVSSLGTSLDGEEDTEVKGQGSEEEEVELAQEEIMPEVVNFQRYGSLPKSTSMSGVKAVRSCDEHRHKRRASLPSGAIQSSKTATFSTGEVVLETEVWSWGEGSQGQLGHGDTLDRLQPCKIKYFNDKKVVEIAAGNFHSLVLTANSQIDRGYPVSGIAAGENHTVVLADDQNFCPTVYFSGTEPGKPGTEENSTDQFTPIPSLQKVGHIRCVSAGGDLCCCISDKKTSGHQSILHEFAASERLFGSQLHLISEEFLKPLLNSDAFQSKDSSQLGMSLGILCDAFFCLSDMTSQNHLELQKVLENTRELTDLQLLSKSEQCIGAFQHYCKCYTDVLSIGGFQTSAKLCSSLFAKSKDLITSVLDTKSFHSKDAGTTFLKLMKLPLLRLKDYCKILSRLGLKFSSFTREKQVLDSSARLWENFYQVTVQDVKRADSTNLFWSTCPTKLNDLLKVASRRLLFDSKTHPLTFQGGGRFTNNLFLLFNDIFAHIQGSYINTYPLSTIWLETASSDREVATGNFIKLIMPEESLTLLAPSPVLKSEWIWAFNQAIDKALSQQRYTNDSASNGPTLSPPRDRHASHKFTKHAVFKDAKYEGMWRLGLMHGQGELLWPDGRRFHGAFKHGSQDGYGVYTIPHEDGEKEVYDGVWRQGKLSGYGYVKYGNGDNYEGHFREGKRHGHGVLKQGKLTSALASIYIGEWASDRKSGYGVYEDILKGQKYMGLWLEDQKHGNGVIVTLDGMYFEGTFQQNKMTGYGLLMTDDNTCYEGEFAGGPNLYGKGTLTLPNGDFIEGTFNGSFTEGIKTNGTFFKAAEDVSQRHGFSHALGIVPKSFGRLSVPPHRKWEEIFDQCCSMLGCTKHSSSTDSSKAWEKCAALIEIGKKMSSGSVRAAKGKGKAYGVIPPELETIPEYSRGHLTIEYYTKIKSYITKAFEWPHHPLGRLLESLVDVYRATYVGVGAHPRLLHHAVQEVHSFLERVYPIVRILFPDLPDGSTVVQIVRENYDEATSFQKSAEDICEVVTPGSLLYPILLPKIYPPLFTLYALYNEKEDERYWRRVVTWNKQSDLALMSYLGIDQRFWMFEDHNMESPQRLSKIRDKSYVDAIETLQGISTSFCPADKLLLIQNTFNKINMVVQDRLGTEYLWCMDDLFPVFQYVVVRARIQHLGAEIHLMDELMEPYLEHGELGLMFTTLKASYYQIQNEKIA